MKRQAFIIILILSLFGGKMAGQCVEAGAPMSICQGATTPALGGILSGDAASPVWTDGAIGGTFSPNETQLDATWTPPPGYSGTATLTLSAKEGSCSPLSDTKQIIVANPTTPIVGTVQQPTCSVPTGGVPLSGLPSVSWTITRLPDNFTTSGSVTSTTITGIPPGSYTFTVTNNVTGCTSAPTSTVVINAQPPSPSTPVVSVDCTLGARHAIVTVTSPVGAGLEYSLDGGSYRTSPVFNNVDNGSHFVAVRNAGGCTTIGSFFSVACGCASPPTVTLSATTGNTCTTAPITVSDNYFGGGATSVIISEDGRGTVTPASSTVSPFSFTYTPAANDAGRTVIITVTTNNPDGSPCVAAIATYTLTVSAVPSAPVVGTITQLTCSVSTGSVVLNGLPSTGNWSITQTPGDIVTIGSGASTTITGLTAGTYNFTLTNAGGCISLPSADVVINPQPSAPTAPAVGVITQPTCSISTGSVVLNGLPATDPWTLTRSPGGLTRIGSGPSETISNIPSGTYNYTVTNNTTQCTSPPSDDVVIIVQPEIPPPPTIGIITAPSCTLSTGSVELLGLPSAGSWTITRFPGTVVTLGRDTARTIISELPRGTYNFNVENEAGCTSGLSTNVIIPAQPPTPLPPVVGTITQPTFTVPSGSVALSGLPSPGNWIITRLPDSVTTASTGANYTITGLPGGLWNFIVENSYGCVSDTSADVIISTPGPPVIIITDPPPVCSPDLVDLTAPSITAGSTTGLTYTYWTDAELTIPCIDPTAVAAGTYWIKGTTVAGYPDNKPVIATIFTKPVPDAGPDQILYSQSSTSLQAKLNENETGEWSVFSGSAEFTNVTDPTTSVKSFASGDNILLWTVDNGACPLESDSVSIIVNDLVIPTLITPNGDQLNEYFELKGIGSLGETELIVFDRRGALVYKNSNYDNKWNGVDYNEKPLPNDTYFFVLKTSKGTSFSGYVVIRK